MLDESLDEELWSLERSERSLEELSVLYDETGPRPLLSSLLCVEALDSELLLEGKDTLELLVLLLLLLTEDKLVVELLDDSDCGEEELELLLLTEDWLEDELCMSPEEVDEGLDEDSEYDVQRELSLLESLDVLEWLEVSELLVESAGDWLEELDNELENPPLLDTLVLERDD